MTSASDPDSGTPGSVPAPSYLKADPTAPPGSVPRLSAEVYAARRALDDYMRRTIAANGGGGLSEEQLIEARRLMRVARELTRALVAAREAGKGKGEGEGGAS